MIYSKSWGMRMVLLMIDNKRWGTRLGAFSVSNWPGEWPGEAEPHRGFPRRDQVRRVGRLASPSQNPHGIGSIASAHSYRHYFVHLMVMSKAV